MIVMYSIAERTQLSKRIAQISKVNAYRSMLKAYGSKRAGRIILDQQQLAESLVYELLGKCTAEEILEKTAEHRQSVVQKITGKEPYKGINPDECVAMGAAIQGGILAGDVKDIVLLDVTPLSLGIETMGGVFTKLIERNTTIPTHKSQIFSTAADGQTSVEVHVLQGEREMAAYNKTLGRFQLGGIAPAPRGVPQIEVTFDIDANGIVKVSAKDLGTGKEANISITASTNLSQEDIDKAVREAEQYAAEDKARKEEVDTHNAADQTVYQTEKTLNELGDKIDASEKASIQAAIDKLKEVNKGSDVAAIKAATEEVQQAFYKVSEKLYQQANPQGGAQGGSYQQPGDDGVVDADYETVD